MANCSKSVDCDPYLSLLYLIIIMLVPWIEELHANWFRLSTKKLHASPRPANVNQVCFSNVLPLELPSITFGEKFCRNFTREHHLARVFISRVAAQAAVCSQDKDSREFLLLSENPEI